MKNIIDIYEGILSDFDTVSKKDEYEIDKLERNLPSKNKYIQTSKSKIIYFWELPDKYKNIANDFLKKLPKIEDELYRDTISLLYDLPPAKKIILSVSKDEIRIKLSGADNNSINGLPLIKHDNVKLNTAEKRINTGYELLFKISELDVFKSIFEEAIKIKNNNDIKQNSNSFIDKLLK